MLVVAQTHNHANSFSSLLSRRLTGSLGRGFRLERGRSVLDDMYWLPCTVERCSDLRFTQRIEHLRIDVRCVRLRKALLRIPTLSVRWRGGVARPQPRPASWPLRSYAGGLGRCALPALRLASCELPLSCNSNINFSASAPRPGLVAASRPVRRCRTIYCAYSAVSILRGPSPWLASHTSKVWLWSFRILRHVSLTAHAPRTPF
jgi:hypothetical protein